LGGFVPSGLVGEVGEVGLVDWPHPIAQSASRMTAPTVDRMALKSLMTMFQGKSNGCAVTPS
jgi:hypothetical protein